MSSDLIGTTGVAERYASALFDLSIDNGELDKVTEDLNVVREAIEISKDFKRFLLSPIFSSEEQAKAIAKVSEKIGLTKTVSNFLGVVALNNRLFCLESIIKAWNEMLLSHNNEVTAEVVSATGLSSKQLGELEKVLTASVGSKITIKEKVDPHLIGGMIVRVGSRMIDSSVRTKLERLKLDMKGAA